MGRREEDNGIITRSSVLGLIGWIQLIIIVVLVINIFELNDELKECKNSSSSQVSYSVKCIDGKTVVNINDQYFVMAEICDEK